MAAGFLREIDSVHRPHLLKVAAENKSGCWTEEIFFCLSSESTYSEWLLGKWLLFVLFLFILLVVMTTTNVCVPWTSQLKYNSNLLILINYKNIGAQCSGKNIWWDRSTARGKKTRNIRKSSTIFTKISNLHTFSNPYLACI